MHHTEDFSSQRSYTFQYKEELHWVYRRG